MRCDFIKSIQIEFYLLMYDEFVCTTLKKTFFENIVPEANLSNIYDGGFFGKQLTAKIQTHLSFYLFLRMYPINFG